MTGERLAFGGGGGFDSEGPAAPQPLERTPIPIGAARRSRSANRGLDWGYAGLLFFTGVLLFRPQDQFRPLAVLHLAQVSAIVGIGSMFANRLRRHLTLIPLTQETVALLVFGFVMLATVPVSIWPGGALSEFLDSYFKAVLVFFLMVNTLTTPKRLEQITWLILVCCGYVAFRAVVDYARGVHLVENGRVAGAVSGIFGNPNDLALNMVTFLPAALFFALTPRYGAIRRLAAAGFAVLMMGTVVFTKSRAGVLGLALALGAFVVFGRRVRPAFTAAIVAATLLAAPFLPSSFWNRMATIANEEQDKALFTGSAEARRVLLEEGVKAFLEHPLTGVGAGQFKNYNPPGRRERWRETHNSLLQVAADLGIFGVLAFVFLILSGVRAAFQSRRLLARAGARVQPGTSTRRNRTGPPVNRDGTGPPMNRGGLGPSMNRGELASPMSRGELASPMSRGELASPMSRGELGSPMSKDERSWLYAYATALTAGLLGWFVCALFASVAYSWTFYYLLALLVATRDLVRERLTQIAPPSQSSQKGKSATWTARIA
jgi:O-antigen ligase